VNPAMSRILAVIVLSLLTCNPVAAAPGPCGRACLYQVLDRYLAAMQAHRVAQAQFAPGARFTENNVSLRPGDGVWATITGLGDYDLRFADPQTGGVGFYGVVHESDTASPFALRLKVRDGQVTESEIIVARPQEAGVPFVTATIATLPVLTQTVPVSERSSRERMIGLANGYFATLQRNDGTLHTQFSDDCNRREDGFQTTNRRDSTYGDTPKLGCAAQFKLGWYRFDDRLRARRFLVVDEERGLVMTSAFIDHAGTIGDYKLTDGRTASSALFRRPHSYCLLETFKIRNARIEQVEAVFTSVPYRMPSPWGGTPDTP
jgi:hypothetical protein